jgi:hypothetical protein
MKAHCIIWQLKELILGKPLPKFATPPKGFVIQEPYQISNADRIYMVNDIKLGPNSVLKVNTRYPGSWLEHPEKKHVSQNFTPELIIRDRVTATSALQITTFNKIVIEEDVMFAANVFICDGMHDYANPNVPYKYQGITRISPIIIKKGSWIGQNVVILPGVTIGECAIVGANSVVTKDVPGRCIAMGVPAKVTKYWDDKSQAWQSDRGIDENIQKKVN